MSRTITTDIATASEQKVTYPAILIELDFDSGSVDAWIGRGTLEVNGRTYQGAGEVLRVDPGEETNALEARGAAFELTCARDEDLSIALLEPYMGRPARIIFALFDSDLNTIPDPVRLFTGKMDVIAVSDDPKRPTLTLTAENSMIILARTKERRLTHEDQQLDYPGDKFFEFVPSMQDRTIQWG